MQPEAAEPPSSRSRHGGPFSTTFRALAHSGYRYLWMGQVGHAAAVWMEQVIRPLLVLEITGSAIQVGSIVTARMVPQLVFGVLAGAVADRYDKQTILKLSQSVTMVMHLSLGLLLLSGHAQLGYIYFTAVANGAANAFVQPARQSLLPRLVPRRDLLNALALFTAAANMMRVLGAGLAGLLLLLLDFGEVYLANAAIYVAVLWTTFHIRVPENVDGVRDPQEPEPRRKGRGSSSLGRDLWEGLRYVRSNRTVLLLVGAALILFVFGQPYQHVFVPLIAQDVLQVDRSRVGLMLSVTGAGALTGALALASLKQVRRRGLLMLGALVAFGGALMGLAHSVSLLMSLPFLFVAGLLSVTYMALNNSLLVDSTPHEFMGRVMSFMSLDRGLMSAGSMLAGALSEWVGASNGLTVMAAACSGLALLTLLLAPRIRGLG